MMDSKSGLLSMVALAVTAQIAAAQTSERSPLTGTAWQLVKFVGGDGATLTPADPTRYTLEFAANGRVSARVDCNRGSGTWQSADPAGLRFGPMAMTRAMCPPGSLHDHIVKQLPNVRSYVLKDGRLFLSLIADGGTFEFTPRAAAEPVSPIAANGPTAFACAPKGGGEASALQVTFYATRPGLALLERDGTVVPAFQVRAASGARYDGDGVSFWEARGEATVRWKGTDLICRPAVTAR
jgi:heat shock protein HslJ